MDIQDILATVAVGDGDGNGDLAVEAPWPPEGRVQGVGNIGGGNDDDVQALVKPVHQGRSWATPRFSTSPTTFFLPEGDGIYLVYEGDAGSLTSGLLKGGGVDQHRPPWGQGLNVPGNLLTYIVLTLAQPKGRALYP